MGGVSHAFNSIADSIKHITNDTFNFIKDTATGHYDEAFKDLGDIIVDGLTLSGVKQFFGLLGIKDYDKWIENAQFVNLLNTNNVYKKTLLSLIKDPTNIKSLQKSIIDLQNNKMLLTSYARYERFGFNVKPVGAIYYVDNESIRLYYESVKNYTNIIINNWKNEDVKIYKQYDFIKSNYYIKDIFSQALKNQTSLGEYSITLGSCKINNKYSKAILNNDGNGNITVKERYDSDNNITYLQFNNIQLNTTDEFTGDGSTDTFDLNDYSVVINSVTIDDNTIDQSEYELVNSFTTSSKIKFNTAPDKDSKIDVNYDYLDEDNDDLIEVEYPTDNRVLIIVDISSDQYNGIDVLLNDDVQTNINYISFLVIPIKDNGEPTGDTIYRKIVFNNFGIKIDDFDSVLSNDDIKDSFITFSATRQDSDLQTLFNYIYGTSDNTKTIKVSTSQYSLEYKWVSVDGENVNVCLFNGKTVDNHTNAFMIPTIYMQYLSVKEYYDLISKYLNLAIYSAVKHHIHWYQTKAFNALLQVGSFAIALATGNTYIFALSTALTLSSNLLPKKYRIYAKIIIAITTGNVAVSSSEIAMNIILIVPKLVTTFYTVKTNKLMKQINEYAEKDKQLEQEIQQLNDKKYRYNPFDKFEDYDFLVYDYSYNPLDALSASMDIENLCKLGA